MDSTHLFHLQLLLRKAYSAHTHTHTTQCGLRRVCEKAKGGKLNRKKERRKEGKEERGVCMRKERWYPSPNQNTHTQKELNPKEKRRDSPVDNSFGGEEEEGGGREAVLLMNNPPPVEKAVRWRSCSKGEN